MSLTNEQLILLDNLIYLNETTNSSQERKVRTIISHLLQMDDEQFEEAVTDEQFYYCKDMVNGMNAEQWKTILNAIASDETLMNMKITNVVDDNDYTGGDDDLATGFRAACFTNGKETAVIFLYTHLLY